MTPTKPTQHFPADWSPGLWFQGRAWLWRERLIALARVPLRRGGWKTNPWQRQPSELLPILIIAASTLLMLSQMI